MNHNYQKRVVITGIGVIAPNALGLEAFKKALFEGKSGISFITRFDVSELPTKIAGEVKFLPNSFLFNNLNIVARQTLFAYEASKMAILDSNIEENQLKNLRKSTIIGTSIPAFDLIEPEIIKLSKKDYKTATIGILKASDPFYTSSSISHSFHFNDSAKTFTTSCSSGLNSIGYAYREIKSGKADICIAGGADSALSPVSFKSFCGAGFMSKRNDSPEKASRPFDKYRDGGVLSEGAGIIILEELEQALNRKAKIYAEIVGYADSSLSVNCKFLEDSFIKVFKESLKEAKIPPSEVDYISAHAPSDPIIDKIETQAIKKVFGKYAYLIPVSSIKSMIGNPLSASGPLQLISCLLSIKYGFVPPTINYEYMDPFCDLDYVPNKARRNKIKYALINVHGFNGSDAALIIKSYK